MRVRALGCARRFCSGRHGAAPRCDAQGCERHCALQARRVGGKIAQHTLPRRTSQLLKWARVLQQFFLSAAVRLRLRAIARRRGGGLPRQRRGAERDPRTTSADRCQRPRSTTDATRPPHLAPSASPTPPRPRVLGGAWSATAAAPASLSRVSDCISRSAAGTQQTTSADQCPRPVGTTDATRPPHLTPSASPTPPRPRLLGGAGVRDRGGARVPFPRLGRHQSSPATAYAFVRRAAAAAGWRTHPAGAPLVRRRPRAVRAAPPPPPQMRPVPSASGPIQRPPRMARSMTAARRQEAASRKHNKLAAPLPPPPPRRFGQELVETSDLSVRRPYSELAPCRAARGELRGQSAPSAASGCVECVTGS